MTYIERKVWMIEKDVENVKEQIERLKAELMKDERKNIRDLRSISQSIKEQKDRIDVFATWKEWIDKFIEKIKKLLPI